MDIVNGKTYRFINVYHDGYGLNIYGTKGTDIKGGQNVCLYSASPTDQMQQWKAVAVSGASDVFQLEAVLNSVYVLDCSDGSISTSYKNNAHMCKKTGTSAVDSGIIAKPVQGVQGNQVRICLPEKNLYLTATTVTEDDTELSNNISTSAALRGGSTGRGNVYWASPASEGSMTWKKQCWEVVEVGGGTDPDPEPGEDITVTGMPDCIEYGEEKTEYFHPDSGMVNGSWSKNDGLTKEEAVRSFYHKVFGYDPHDDQHFLYNLYGAKYNADGYRGKYHTGIDMYGIPGTAANGEDKLTIHSAHAGTVVFIGTGYGTVAIYDGHRTYLYLHMKNICVSAGDSIKVGDKLGIQSHTGLTNGDHLHIEVQEGKAKSEAALPTINDPIESISPYEYL